MSGTFAFTRGKKKPQVLVVLGSRSDLPVIERLTGLLEEFGIAHAVEIASAHRQPRRLHRLVAAGDRAGVRLYVAVAGMAAHLPGVLASLTDRPVLGVPVAAGPLAGVDALLSMTQMPPGVPVGTLGIGSAGAANAAVLAARILAAEDPQVAAALARYRRRLARPARP